MEDARKDEILIRAAETFYAEEHPDDGTPLVTKVMMVCEVNCTDSEVGADTFIMVISTSDMAVWDSMGFAEYALEIQRHLLETG